MSYPQAKSSKSVLEGQEFFRIHTELESNGDLYEVDTSAKAIVIGPNSDIQNVRVYYYDVQGNNQIESAIVSIDDPVVTRMNAFMAQEYPGLGAKARILIGSDDIVPHLPGMPLVEPQVQGDLIVWFKPVIDVLCYHRDPPSLPSTRGERQWQMPITILDRGEGTGISSYYFPHYRRKYFHVRFFNPALLTGYTFRLFGITFGQAVQTAGSEGYPGQFWDAIIGPVALGGIYNAGDYVLYAIHPPSLAAPRAYPMGYYDYILLVVSGDDVDGSDETTQLAFDAISTDWA